MESMQRLWAPWRSQYITSHGKSEGCILCDKHRERSDAANYVLFRGKYNYIMMNLYPYNPGHLMVAPYNHISAPDALSPAELHEHVELVATSVKVLREVLHSEGFNTGMNIGRVAGAGIDSHVHSHIVPRWAGDTNFMPAIADTRVVSQSMDDIFRQLQGKF